jgi:hypothetical protein
MSASGRRTVIGTASKSVGGGSACSCIESVRVRLVVLLVQHLAIADTYPPYYPPFTDGRSFLHLALSYWKANATFDLKV